MLTKYLPKKADRLSHKNRGCCSTRACNSLDFLVKHVNLQFLPPEHERLLVRVERDIDHVAFHAPADVLGDGLAVVWDIDARAER